MQRVEDAKMNNTHALIRTSPKGEKFIGTCIQCGTPNLSMNSVKEECPNQRGISCDEALLEVIEIVND